MRTTRTLALFIGLITTFVIVSCKKSKDLNSSASTQADDAAITSVYKPGVLLQNGSILSGGVTLTAPTQVDVNQSFNIAASIECGRVAIERGYILAQDGFTKIYKDLSCSTSGLLWESLVGFQCYTVDATWNGSIAEPGNYVFRTKHNSSDGNCDGLGGQNNTGECSFNGNEEYCFVIEAMDECETSFTGEAISCGAEREAVYTFTSEEDQDYIKIQGGLTNFTGADAEVTVSDPNLLVSQGTPGGATNRVIKVEGSVDACQTITIRIKWNSSNTGGIITGSWSVKDGNGADIAPAVEGLECK